MTALRDTSKIEPKKYIFETDINDVEAFDSNKFSKVALKSQTQQPLKELEPESLTTQQDVTTENQLIVPKEKDVSIENYLLNAYGLDYKTLQIREDMKIKDLEHFSEASSGSENDSGSESESVYE